MMIVKCTRLTPGPAMAMALLAAACACCAHAQEFSKQTFTYKKAQGCEIKLDIMRPEGNGVRPVILWIHGGALIFGHRSNINREQLRRYLRAGFAVVSIDYRLAPESKLPAILEDVRDAHQWLRENGRRLLRIDPERLAVVGHSAGGYLTLMAGTLLKPPPRALVSFYGYGDIAGEWYSRPDPFYSAQPAVTELEARSSVGSKALSEPPRENTRFRFYLYCRQRGLWPKEVTGVDPDAEPARFIPWCPLRNVTRDYPPTLLLHGDKDTDVPYQQSVLMAAELEKHGVVHDMVTIPGGPHGFDHAMEKAEAAAAFERALDFLKRHLKP